MEKQGSKEGHTTGRNGERKTGMEEERNKASKEGRTEG